MEVSDLLTMTPEQRAKRKEEYDKRIALIKAGQDADRLKAQERALKALFLLKEHVNGNRVLSEPERVALAGIVVERCIDSLFFFAKHVLEMDLLTEQTHKKWADDLQSALYRGKKRMMRLKPRGCYKCLCKGTPLLPYGIDEEYNTVPVQLYNQGDFKEEGLEITTKLGRKHTCTKDHLFKTFDGWHSPEAGLKVAVFGNGKLEWDEIISVEPVGIVEFSAIGSSNETYLSADGMIHHNTTLYGLAHMLWLWGCVSPQIRVFYTSANSLLLQEVSDKLNQYIGTEKSETLYSLIFGITKDPVAKNTSDVFNIKGRSGKGFSLVFRTSGGSSVGIHPNICIVDDPCFVGETPILTKGGYVPIKDIKVGDQVLTRSGFKKVIRSWKTKVNADVADYNINGNILTCTESHKIITDKGKKEISLLNDDIIIKYEDGRWWPEIIMRPDVTNKRRADVYNITVEDVHEFVANGILVANCDQNDRDSDTTRQSKARWFDGITPLLVPFFDPKTGISLETILYIGTHWHLRDLIWHIEETNKKLPEDSKWDIESESVFTEDRQARYPEFFPLSKIMEIKANISDVFFSCNPAGAPILLPDFTTKDIKDICPGDRVIGFTLADGMQKKSKLVETEVINVGKREADVVKITLESGRVIRCTADHKWYTGRSWKDDHNTYLPAKVGRNLLRVVDCHYHPTFEDLLNWRYLGGLLDGEGACKQGQLSLHQSSIKNPEVYRNMLKVLDDLKIPYSIYPHGKKRGCDQIHIMGGRDTKVKILRYTGCAKRGQILSGILSSGGRTVACERLHLGSKHHDPKVMNSKGRDKVISIEPDGRETVYSFQTETGNYVVWGYASKNCQYENNPLSEGMQVFDLKKLFFTRKDQIELDKGEMLCVFDPSLGKTHSDYAAVWWLHFHNNKITIIDAIDDKVELNLIVHQIANKNMEYGCRHMIYENNGISLVEESLRSAHNRLNWHIHIEGLHHSSNKDERIMSMQPALYSGQVQFMSDYEIRYPEAMAQLIFYPVYGHDDFPDCLQMGIEHFKQARFKFIRYEGML